MTVKPMTPLDEAERALMHTAAYFLSRPMTEHEQMLFEYIQMVLAQIEMDRKITAAPPAPASDGCPCESGPEYAEGCHFHKPGGAA